jgi:hypothetical protein
MDPTKLVRNPLIVDLVTPELGGKLVRAVHDDMLRAQREAEEKAKREAEEKAKRDPGRRPP